jgi:hypothetical protein
VDVRYYIDPETDRPHMYRHGVVEREVEEVLRRPLEDRPSREGSRADPSRPLSAGDLRARSTAELGVCHHGVPTGPQGAASTSTAYEEKMSGSKYPPGWDEERVRRVLDHYEAQSDEEAVAEDEAAYEATTHTVMDVPVELVPVIRELIAKRRAG